MKIDGVTKANFLGDRCYQIRIDVLFPGNDSYLGPRVSIPYRYRDVN